MCFADPGRMGVRSGDVFRLARTGRVRLHGVDPQSLRDQFGPIHRCDAADHLSESDDGDARPRPHRISVDRFVYRLFSAAGRVERPKRDESVRSGRRAGRVVGRVAERVPKRV